MSVTAPPGCENKKFFQILPKAPWDGEQGIALGRKLLIEGAFPKEHFDVLEVVQEVKLNSGFSETSYLTLGFFSFPIGPMKLVSNSLLCGVQLE